MSDPITITVQEGVTTLDWVLAVTGVVAAVGSAVAAVAAYLPHGTARPLPGTATERSP